MDKDLRVNRFKDRLLERSQFSISKVNDLEWRVESKDCRITFNFDRYSEGYMILVSDPKSAAPGANFSVLRHIRGARNVLVDGGSPENFAEIFNKYFDDVLRGDFSILKEYEAVGRGFGAYLMEALSLNDDDPIKIKAKNFDISWLEDFKKRNEIN